MTRKKSNVKALALAVTCAILAGGYSGLNPVYAGDVTYDTTTKKLQQGTTPTDITEIIVGGVTIGGTGESADQISLSKIVGITNGSSIGSIDINGATFASNGAITASKLMLGEVNVSENLTTLSGNIETNKNNINALQTTVGNDSSGLVKDVSDNKTDISSLKTTVGDADSGLVKDTNILKQIVGDVNSSGLAFNTQKISYNRDSKFTQVNGALKIVGVDDSLATLTLEQGSTTGSINAEKLNAVDGAVTVSNGSTLINAKLNGGYDSKIGDVKFEQDGKISGVQDINNGFLKIQQDSDGNDTSLQVSGDLQVGTINAKEGSTIGKVEFTDKGILANKNETNQVQINEEGIVVGKNSTVIGSDGVYAGGHTEATAKAVLSADGSIKGAGDGTGNYKFTVDGTTGNVTTAGDIQGKDIIATGALKGASLEVTGNATVGGTLNSKGNFSVGDADHFTVNAASGNVKTIGTITAESGGNIGGVTFDNAGKIAGVKSIKTDDLTVNNGFNVTGNMTVNGIIKGTEVTDGSGASLKDGKITAKTGDVAGVKFETGGVVTGVNDITAAKGTIGNVTLEGGKVTASEGKIGSVEITTAGVVTGVSSLSVNGEIKANTFKVDDDNYLNNNGITTKKGGHIGAAVINETTLTVGSTELDKTEGVTTNKLKIGGMTLTDTKLDTGTADFQVNGVTFNQGQVTAHADKGFVTGGSSLKENSLTVDANNKLEATNGLTTVKASVNGSLDVTGKATFGTGTSKTTIESGVITTETLKTNKLVLGNHDGASDIVLNADGSFSAANGAFSVAADGKTTFKKDDDNVSSINGGNIWAKATDSANHVSSTLTHTANGLNIVGTKAGKSSSTTIIGSEIRSTDSDGNAGKLDGNNLKLYNATNGYKTNVTSGEATYDKGGTDKTTIDGGTITTETLKVNDIILGGTMYDVAGNPLNGKLSIGSDGHLRAANGNFDVKADGSFKNTVGDTKLETTAEGATISNGNASIEVKNGNITDKVGDSTKNTTITTTDSSFTVKGKDGNGMDINTETGKTTFTGANYDSTATTPGTTTIEGNTITTGKLITDKLVIKGNGSGDTSSAGGESGSIAFGGDGTITSNIKDGDKETTFTTNADGVKSDVTDGTYTATNEVTSKKIGSVITGGAVEISQELNAETGKITNKAGDTSTELGNDGFAVKQNGYTDVNIAKGDVSVTNKNTGKQVNLSDLGTLGDLNEEITSREEYTKNSTAVGAINSVSGRLTDEVNRLDGRINDVSDRVNKVGAMAAAIASLKSIGYDPQAPSEFSIGLGQYKGETGVAMGFFHYPNKNFMINVSLSTAGGETMGGIGATWRFGHKSPQKLLDEQRAAQAKKELAAAEKYQTAAKLAKEAQERAEYAAKLARQAQVSADNAKAAADATQAKHFQ